MMTIFPLTLQPTYYAQGFFNVTVDYDRYVRSREGPILLILGEDGEQTIEGRIDREANLNGTARIHGGARLRDWFQANFAVMDDVCVDVTLPDLILLARKSD